MPPKAKFTRDEIVAAALELVRESGVEGVNARAVAKKLGTSPSPIFTVFSTMEELKEAVFDAAMTVFYRYTADWRDYSPPAKRWALQMVRFAREEPKLFRLLFMQERVDIPLFDESQMENRHHMPIQEWGEAMHLTPEQAHTMFYNLWIFLYGICTMLALRVCTFTDEELAERIGMAFAGQLLLIRSGKEAYTRVMPTEGVNQVIMGRNADSLPYDET